MNIRTALLALLCASPAAASPPLLFRGNVLFDELVYRSVLQLPDTAGDSAGEVLAIEATLSSFLRRAGYDLATVHASVAEGQVIVDIDEGRLDKIIVFGEGFVETLRFRRELALPGGIFNRPALERQLRILSERYRVRRYSYALLPAEVQESHGPQIELLDPLLGGSGVRPGLRYQLHIVIANSPWSRGFSPLVAISWEGLGLGGEYRDRDFFAPDDRWEVRGRIAASVRGHLDTPGSEPVFTRAQLQGRWLSPPVFTESLRPAITVRGELLSLQRSDLHLESFNQATFASSFDAGVFKPTWTFAAGIGIERRFIYGLVKALGASPELDSTPGAQTRPYAEVLGDVTFNPQELRTDRRHLLDFEARFYTGSTSSDQAIWLRAGWQCRAPIGWHELVWQVRVTVLEGQVLFPDEESLGDHLHGAFGGSDFVRKAAAAGLEFRYSLLRDIAKLGIFYDQAVYGSINRDTGVARPQWAGAGGAAAHLLFADEFQIDLYAALGWKGDGGADFALSLVLRQVF